MLTRLISAMLGSQRSAADHTVNYSGSLGFQERCLTTACLRVLTPRLPSEAWAGMASRPGHLPRQPGRGLPQPALPLPSPRSGQDWPASSFSNLWEVFLGRAGTSGQKTLEAHFSSIPRNREVSHNQKHSGRQGPRPSRRVLICSRVSLGERAVPGERPRLSRRNH